MSNKTNLLFEPFEFSGIKLRNRFVRSATVNNFADEENRFTAGHQKLYSDLARGGVGLIMGGALRLKREWVIGHVFQQPCLDIPGIEDEMREMVDEMHQLGASFVSQITAPYKIRGKQVSGASVDVDVVPEPLDEQDMMEIKAAYRNAGRVLSAAGCDGVQMHCCHNDVLSRMISPLFNKRQDIYGGPPENRARLVLEIVQELKEGAENDFPVMIKMNCSDFREDGMTVDEAAEIAAILAAGGICAIEPTCSGAGASCTPSGPIKKDEWHEGFLIDYAARIKKAVDVPVMVVGGLRKLQMMEDVIKSGKADLISMCRPFIREPGLIARWAAGDTEPSTCTSCDGCLTVTTRREKLRCVQTTRADGTPR
jgi:2,4-dienoyl-CoA reductase-like NADH-dependent reductase (Old Yellow Enzyme family)